VRYVWRESTRNHHCLEVGGLHVASVLRAQKHRPDGTKADWRIQTLNTGHWGPEFRQEYDERDLASAKQAAEQQATQVIKHLCKLVHGR
jgi:hypothetical protein